MTNLEKLYNEALKNLDNANVILMKSVFFVKIQHEDITFQHRQKTIPYLCGMQIKIDDSILENYKFIKL